MPLWALAIMLEVVYDCVFCLVYALWLNWWYRLGHRVCGCRGRAPATEVGWSHVLNDTRLATRRHTHGRSGYW